MSLTGIFRQSCHSQIFLISISLIYLNNGLCSEQQQQQQQAPVVPTTKVIVPNLPLNHYQFWLKNNQRAQNKFKHICAHLSQQDKGISYDIETKDPLFENLEVEDLKFYTDSKHRKTILKHVCSKIKDITNFCWGYEFSCQKIYLMPECLGSSLGEAEDQQKQKIIWFGQADFGFILDRRKELVKFCSPDKESKTSVTSSFQCSKYFTTCRGDYLFVQFDKIPNNGSILTARDANSDYTNIIKKGNIGGWNCDFQSSWIGHHDGQRGALQSWYTELQYYSKYTNLDQTKACDLTFQKQVFVVKLDSPSNMYHYFCTFINLYATLHLNNKFSDDNEIIIWDNHLPRSRFEDMWRVFSRNQLISINQLENKRVCFNKFVFALPPRMTNGLYYNTPLIAGCSKSGLFHAFNRHVLHKLGIEQDYTLKLHKSSENKPIRVTIVSRKTYRKLLNEDDLKVALSNKSHDFQVNLVDFSDLSFLEQLKISQNTDILVGIHGAGLTHTLFLPDWATLFELYDCKDKCYHDLARLRGARYVSFKEPEKFVKKRLVEDPAELEKLRSMKLVEEEKYANYEVDKDEFVSVLERAVERMREDRNKYFRDLVEEFPELGSSIATTEEPPKQEADNQRAFKEAEPKQRSETQKVEQQSFEAAGSKQAQFIPEKKDLKQSKSQSSEKHEEL